MSYIDGFVAPVPADRRAAYLDFTRQVAVLFREWGALEVVDAWGDDVPDGETTSFPMAVKLAPGETVAFGWIVWPDKAARDAAFVKMQTDERMAAIAPQGPPFDGKRMFFGGFTLLHKA